LISSLGATFTALGRSQRWKGDFLALSKSNSMWTFVVTFDRPESGLLTGRKRKNTFSQTNSLGVKSSSGRIHFFSQQDDEIQKEQCKMKKITGKKRRIRSKENELIFKKNYV
jgi:hypothetical protein